MAPVCAGFDHPVCSFRDCGRDADSQVLGSTCALEMCKYVGVREAGTEGLIAEGYSVRRDRGTEDLGRQTTVPC